MLKERQEFVAKTRREADELLEAARVQAERMVQRTEVVRAAEQRARQMMETAETDSRRLRHETEDFLDQRLGSFEILLDKLQKTVAAGRQRLSIGVVAAPTLARSRSTIPPRASSTRTADVASPHALRRERHRAAAPARIAQAHRLPRRAGRDRRRRRLDRRRPRRRGRPRHDGGRHHRVTGTIDVAVARTCAGAVSRRSKRCSMSPSDDRYTADPIARRRCVRDRRRPDRPRVDGARGGAARRSPTSRCAATTVPGCARRAASTATPARAAATRRRCDERWSALDELRE